MEVSSTKTYDTGWSRRLDEGVERIIEICFRRHRRANQIHPRFQASDGAGQVTESSRESEFDQDLVKKASSKDHIDRLRENRSKGVRRYWDELFWALVRANNSVSVVGGETDENVTVDVKRVIRHLGSLHGKSGLRVTEIPFDRLDPDGSNPFDAFKEAVVFVGSEDKRIRLLVDDVRA